MEKMLYWLVRWPWIAAGVVLIGLAPLSLGPWYVNAWLGVGAALMAMSVARAANLQFAEPARLRTTAAELGRGVSRR